MIKKPNKTINFLVVFLLVFAIYGMVANTLGNKSTVTEILYSDFDQKLADGELKTINVRPNLGVYEITGELASSTKEKEQLYKVVAPQDTTTIEKINEQISESGLEVTVSEMVDNSFATTMFSYLILIGATGMILMFVTNRMTKQNSRAMKFGDSKAKAVVNSNIKFADVAGYNEEKQELAEIVEFLQNPSVFNEMGARIPKGILLEGPPGTGKTLLAKSVAGEASVPFFSISGSDFVEMFVGVGASRVRDLFKTAQKSAPAIVFIDEIDAVGRRRGNGIGGGNDEREQTLNQMLVEMDGFAPNSGVVVIAATNRSDVLDPALLRPGRFDRQVQVGLPDLKAREEILQLHKSKRKFAESVNIKEYAQNTAGLSGADLENVINESAIVAVRHRKKAIDNEDMMEAIDRVLAGPAKVSRKYSDGEKKMVSYHETGHVIVGMTLKEADEIQKVTIIPRGSAGGYAMFAPKEEKFFTTKTELLHKITGLLAGRASEELYIGEITTGAHNDFERATKMARAMVTKFGMTDLGKLQYELEEDLMNPYYTRKYSEEIQNKIDAKINEILDTCYEDAKRILTERKDDVDLVATTLFTVETLTRNEIHYLIENRHLPEKELSEKYTDEEIKEIEMQAIRTQLFILQTRQKLANEQNPDKKIEVYTDEQIEQMVKDQYALMQKRKIKQPLVQEQEKVEETAAEVEQSAEEKVTETTEETKDVNEDTDK